MEIQRLKINVEQCYITKPIDHETIGKVLATQQSSTTHQLYMMINDFKSLQYCLELDHPKFAISSYIKMQYAYCGDAKRQAETISFMKDYVKKRPSFEIKYRFYRKIGDKTIFNFNHITTDKHQIYKIINQLENKTRQLCKINT